jgi:hypothetical protein
LAPGVKTLTAFYDLQYGPVSFDFVTWLVLAMKERDARGHDGMHVVIVPKEDGLGGFSRHWGKHDEAATRWRLWHIVVASCPLAGATVTVAASRAQAERMKSEPYWWPEGKAHFMGPLIQAARNGEAIPKLRATEAAKRYVSSWIGVSPKLVTLTIRNQSTDHERNSELRNWERLRDLAVAAGCSVVWLDDANVALSDGRGYAELDPDLRLALYERAAMNFIGNNGPQELLKFSGAPYIIVGLALTDGWKDHFRKYFDMKPGEQLPWARKDQRMVYEPDSFDVMRCEFEKWEGGE